MWPSWQEWVLAIIVAIPVGIIIAICLQPARKLGSRLLRQLKGRVLSSVGTLRRRLSIRRLLGIEELKQRLEFLDSKFDGNLDVLLNLMASMEDKLTTLGDKVKQLEAKSNPSSTNSDEEQK